MAKSNPVEPKTLVSTAGLVCAQSPDALTPCASSSEPTAAIDARPPRPAKPDPDRVRLCVVSRQELPPDALIRFVAAPDDSIVPDLARRLPGRGVWVTATKAAVADAVKRGLFAKSLKRFVKADKDLVAHVERMLALEARQALSLANKAGLVTTGFSKVEIALEKRLAEALLTASDASIDGAGKLARKFRAIRAAAGQKAPVIQEFSTDELSLAIGGSNVVHAALASGGLGRRVIACCYRLQQFRMTNGFAEDAPVTAAADALPDLALPAPGLDLAPRAPGSAPDS